MTNELIQDFNERSKRVFVNKYYKEYQDACWFCRMRSDPKIEMDVMWERKEYTSDLTDAEWAIIEP